METACFLILDFSFQTKIVLAVKDTDYWTVWFGRTALMTEIFKLHHHQI